ncbi:MAG: hypothetical protein ABJK20_06245, partial [Halieaceae bacterium]
MAWMVMAAECVWHTAGGRGYALRRLIAGVLLCAFALQTIGGSLGTSRFSIDAPLLAPALIQFSQQSGLAIVFSKRLTRNK